MSVDVSTEITIDRPPAEVAAFAVNPDNAPRWYENIESIEWKTLPPLAVGSRIAFVARFLGRRLEYTYQVVELDAERLVMSTSAGPFPMETTYSFRPEGSGGERTGMTLRNHGMPSGFARIGAPVIAAAMRRANTRDLARLKQLLESRGSD
jgi:hypothetical protein